MINAQRQKWHEAGEAKTNLWFLVASQPADRFYSVIPAKAGIQYARHKKQACVKTRPVARKEWVTPMVGFKNHDHWIPAFAGMTQRQGLQ